MNIKIFPERCIACGLCRTYNEVFDYDIDGLVCFNNAETSLVMTPDPTLMQAEKACPTRAIKITH